MLSSNGGRLSISRGGGNIIFLNGQTEQRKIQYLLHDHPGVTIVCQLDANAEIDLRDALTGHQPVDLFLESLGEPSEKHLVSISNYNYGTGSRQAGAKLRNIVNNVFAQMENHVQISFKGINVVSSSYADEFIGNLAEQFVSTRFHTYIELADRNDDVRAIVDRSVALRLYEQFRVRP